jgi:hypothetical protein
LLARHSISPGCGTSGRPFASTMTSRPSLLCGLRSGLGRRGRMVWSGRSFQWRRSSGGQKECRRRADSFPSGARLGRARVRAVADIPFPS